MLDLGLPSAPYLYIDQIPTKCAGIHSWSDCWSQYKVFNFPSSFHNTIIVLPKQLDKHIQTTIIYHNSRFFGHFGDIAPYQVSSDSSILMFDKQLGKVSIRSLGQLNLQQPNQVLNFKAHLLKILGCSFIKHLWQYIEIKILVPLFPNST